LNGSLDPLKRELDAWATGGRDATFWWRDDDAATPSAALDALLDVAAAAPVALAVIPHDAAAALASQLADLASVIVLQHGYAHANHAPAGEKKMELGPHRRADHVIAELATGQDRLSRLFDEKFLPVLVPPWNRIASFLVPMLPEMKFCGLSTYGPRTRAEPVSGFRQVNTHVDLIDWRGGRDFIGPAAAAAATAAHLADRRQGHADPAEPTGILTHHLVQDPASWQFMAELLSLLDAHPAATVMSAAALFEHPE
jgi:hypothetical protein